MVGIDKMSLCTALRTVNSSLPLATSSPLERLSPATAGARFDSTNYQTSILASKPSVEADRLTDIQRKKGDAPLSSPAPWLLLPPSRLPRGNFANFDVALLYRRRVLQEHGLEVQYHRFLNRKETSRR
jgi:hypothetical protein